MGIWGGKDEVKKAKRRERGGKESSKDASTPKSENGQSVEERIDHDPISPTVRFYLFVFLVLFRLAFRVVL